MDAKVEILKNATKRTLTINEGSPLHSAVMVAMDDYAKEKSEKFTEWLLKNCYILNHCRWEYRGTNYTTSEIYDLYLKL